MWVDKDDGGWVGGLPGKKIMVVLSHPGAKDTYIPYHLIPIEFLSWAHQILMNLQFD